MNTTEVLAELERLLTVARSGLSDEVSAAWTAVLASAWPGVEVEVLSLQHEQVVRGRREALLGLLDGEGLSAQLRWVDGPTVSEGRQVLGAAGFEHEVCDHLPPLRVRVGRVHRSLSVVAWSQMLSADTSGATRSQWVEESLAADVQHEQVVAREVSSWVLAHTACQLGQDSGVVPAGSLTTIPASGVHPAGLEWIRTEGLDLARAALAC